jgi:FkbM family methyltransferase
MSLVPHVTYRNAFGVFSLLPNEEYILGSLKQNIPWEKDLLECVLPCLDKSMVVLDIGSHVGTHSIPYSQKCKQVYAFEAQSTIYSLLLLNMYQNGCTNIIPMFGAVGHCKGQAHMSLKVSDGVSSGKSVSYDTTDPINYGGMQLGKGNVTLDMITIDSLHLTIGYMKIDVEGAEPLVFYGAKETIKRCKPIILFERNHKHITQDMIDDMKLNKEVIEMDIHSYCFNLGYLPAVPLTTTDYLLLPQNNVEMLKLLAQSVCSQCQVFEEKNLSFTVKIKRNGSDQDRGPFSICMHKMTVFLVCTDETKTYSGQMVVSSKNQTQINWNNGTVWFFATISEATPPTIAVTIPPTIPPTIPSTILLPVLSDVDNASYSPTQNTLLENFF